ncbi:MAG: hypothetical protein M1812_006274 [Candelaria pacifica]|nr:MAG: hypothetical protein M1812_006274 [Candelaria pacifica]
MPPRLPTCLHLQLEAGNGISVDYSVLEANESAVLAGFTSQSSISRRAFTPSSRQCKPTSEKQRKHRDPYALAQARALKAANLKRQEVLKKERAGSLGNPVRGILTPFVESLDHALPQTVKPSVRATTRASKAEASSEPQPPPADAINETHLNYFVSSSELADALERSHFLTEPTQSSDQDKVDAEVDAKREAADSDKADSEEAESKRREMNTHSQQHAKAQTALARIVSLANGNSQDKTRVNIQRCIDTFGRHNTDQQLKQRAPSNVPRGPGLPPAPEKTPRAGPDTGSSEVQIGVLTTKIRVLANHLETIGRTDKVNKRNLRLLVHRRQKLLTYLRRKERGGARWQNLVNTLGLTDGTWMGEISL